MADRRTIEEVRAILARVEFNCNEGDDDCTPGSCKGWDVFNDTEVQVCDMCNSGRPADLKLTDDDVVQLPEAQEALKATTEEECEACGGAMAIYEPPAGMHSCYTCTLCGHTQWGDLLGEYGGGDDDEEEED